MGGDEDLRSGRDQLLERCRGDGGAFARVGICGDLVDEDQRPGTRCLEDVAKRGEVGRERGQIAREVPFVSNRRVHGAVQRHP